MKKIRSIFLSQQFQSRVVHVLPKIIKVEERSIEFAYSVEQFFRYFREYLGYTTWDELALFIPIGGKGDANTQHRTMMRWLQGEKIPEYGAVETFLQGAIQEFGDYSHQDWLDIFSASVFMNKLLDLVAECLPFQQAVRAFHTYQSHFDRHVAEVTRDQVTP